MRATGVPPSTAAVTVETATGPLRVVSAHLNPFSPYRRMREAIWLAHRYRPDKLPTVIAGDLNGLDPGTDHTETLAPQPTEWLLDRFHPGVPRPHFPGRTVPIDLAPARDLLGFEAAHPFEVHA